MVNEIEIKLLREGAVIPEYATEGSAAVDLRVFSEYSSSIGFQLEPGQCTKLMSTGIAIHIGNPNIAAIIIPRSGLGSKFGIVLGNGTGLIDSDYQGEIKIAVYNRSQKVQFVKAGDRVAQMFFVPIVRPSRFKVVDEFSSESERGEGGFGHTGTA